MTPPEVAEVPPNSSLFSITSVLAPCAAATTAAVRAAAPEPTTSTSVSGPTARLAQALPFRPRVAALAQAGGRRGIRRGRTRRRAWCAGRGRPAARSSLHPRGGELLAVPAAGGAGDRLVHQRAAEVVDAGLRGTAPRPRGPSFTHEAWMLRDAADAARAAPPRASAAPRGGRPAARRPFALDRRLHVHERQRHELGEAAGLALQLAHGEQVPRPVHAAPRRGRT